MFYDILLDLWARHANSGSLRKGKQTRMAGQSSAPECRLVHLGSDAENLESILVTPPSSCPFSWPHSNLVEGVCWYSCSHLCTQTQRSWSALHWKAKRLVAVVRVTAQVEELVSGFRLQICHRAEWMPDQTAKGQLRPESPMTDQVPKTRRGAAAFNSSKTLAKRTGKEQWRSWLLLERIMIKGESGSNYHHSHLSQGIYDDIRWHFCYFLLICESQHFNIRCSAAKSQVRYI